jgi:DNA replication protein DnaC
MANAMLEGFDFEFGPGVGKELERAAADASMILLVGQTGAGKSHFINSIAPGTCKESARLDSCMYESPGRYGCTSNVLPLQAHRNRLLLM